MPTLLTVEIEIKNKKLCKNTSDTIHAKISNETSNKNKTFEGLLFEVRLFFVMLPYKGKQISSRRLSMLAGWLAIGEFSKCPKQIYGSSNSIGIRFSELASSGVREQYKKHVGHVSHGQKRFLLNNYRER